MSITRSILATYRSPSRAVRRLLQGGQREDRALAYLFAGCLLVFVSFLPQAARQAHLSPDVPLEARIGGAILGWLILMPLILYVVAGLSHLLARIVGGKGTWFGARIALFWALLAAAPLWLFHGLIAGFIGPGPGRSVVGGIAALAFLIFWLAGLREAEKGNA